MRVASSDDASEGKEGLPDMDPAKSTAAIKVMNDDIAQRMSLLCQMGGPAGTARNAKTIIVKNAMEISEYTVKKRFLPKLRTIDLRNVCDIAKWLPTKAVHDIISQK
jgi:hypothetical protein